MAAGQTYRGKHLRIIVDGKPLYHATSCSLDVTTNMDEVETKDTDGNIVTPGNYNFTLSTDGLVAEGPAGGTHVDTFDLLQLQLDGTSLAFEFANVGTSGDTPEAGTKLISGNMYVNSTGISSDTPATATGSHSFTGNGNLTITTVA